MTHLTSEEVKPHDCSIFKYLFGGAFVSPVGLFVFHTLSIYRDHPDAFVTERWTLFFGVP